MTKQLKQLAFIAENLERSAKFELDKFKANFEKNPSYAFKWADDAMIAAAALNVALCLKEWTTMKHDESSDEEFYGKLVTEMKDRVFRAARWPSRSTSPASNFMDASEAAAFAGVLEKIRYS